MYKLYRALWKYGVEMRVVPDPGTENGVTVFFSKNGYEYSIYIWAMQYDRWFSEERIKGMCKIIQQLSEKIDKLDGLE